MSLRPISAATVGGRAVTGQYCQGAVGGEPVRGYDDELGRPSTTETFVAPKPAAWDVAGITPKDYNAGTWGHSAAIALAERDECIGMIGSRLPGFDLSTKQWRRP